MEQTLFLRNAGLERLEWSGRKSGESVVERGRNSAEAVRIIWRPAPVRTASLGARSAEPLADQPSRSASVRSVKPGLVACE